MAPPEPSDQQGQQTRTSAAEIHAAIERLLAGEAFLANRPWSEIWWGLMHLDLFSGWRRRPQRQPSELSAAGAKGGRRAAAGCAGWEQPRSRDLARASARLAALAWRRMCSRRIARINTTRGSPPRWASSQLSTSSLRRIT